MRKIFFPLLVLIAGCSAPRYYGYFGDQSYRFPVPEANQVTRPTQDQVTEVPLASAADEETQLSLAAAPAQPVAKPKTVQRPAVRIRNISQPAGKKAVRLTSYSAPASSGLDDDLKFAIILGAAGLVGLFLMIVSQIFGILGGLLLIGGVVFFTRWMLRQ